MTMSLVHLILMETQLKQILLISYFHDITGGTADASGTIDLSGLTSADTVTVSGYISSTHKADVEGKLQAGIDK